MMRTQTKDALSEAEMLIKEAENTLLQAVHFDDNPKIREKLCAIMSTLGSQRLTLLMMLVMPLDELGGIQSVNVRSGAMAAEGTVTE